VTGIEAAVNYLYHGPLGLQTRDLTWKPEYRKALATSIETLKLMGRESPLKAETFVDDQYIRAAFKLSGLDYEARLKNYDKLPLKANDAVTGKPITDFQRVAGLWVQGEPKVRHYASIEGALADLQKLEQGGKKAKAVYVHDLIHRIKLLAANAWFVADAKGQLSAFLQKDAANAYAAANKGRVLDFASAQAGVKAAGATVAKN
jgi:NitT/TauT family transport system substrate-binding protein